MQRSMTIAFSALLILSLPACSRLFKWAPVRTGVEFEGDSVIRVGNVEIRVCDFGVMNSWGTPGFTLEIHNQSSEEVVFDPAACTLEIGDKLAVPEKHPPLPLRHLAPGERMKVAIWFDSGLQLVPREDPSRKDMRVAPEVLELHLAPIAIGGTVHTMPTLSFRNPRD